MMEVSIAAISMTYGMWGEGSVDLAVEFSDGNVDMSYPENVGTTRSISLET